MEKQVVRYKDADVFGKNFSKVAKNSPDIITKLFFEGVVLLNGKVDLTRVNKVEKKWLWRYLRYIWFYNHSKPYFQNNLPQELDAQRLVAIVLSNNANIINHNTAERITNEQIANTINIMIDRYGSELEIPALNGILDRMKGRLASSSQRNNANTRVNTAQSAQAMQVPVRLNYFKNTNDEGKPIVLGQTQETVPIVLKNGELTISVKIAGNSLSQAKNRMHKMSHSYK